MKVAVAEGKFVRQSGAGAVSWRDLPLLSTVLENGEIRVSH